MNKLLSNESFQNIWLLYHILLIWTDEGVAARPLIFYCIILQIFQPDMEHGLARENAASYDFRKPYESSTDNFRYDR